MARWHPIHLKSTPLAEMMGASAPPKRKRGRAKMSERMVLMHLTVQLQIPETWTAGRRCEVMDSALTSIATLIGRGAESGTVIIPSHGEIGSWFMTREPIDDDVATRIRECVERRGRDASHRDRLGCGDKPAGDDGSGTIS